MGAKEDRLSKERYLEKLRLIREGGTANPFETKEEKEARIKRCKKDVREFVKYYFARYATAESADFHVALAKRVARNQRCFELVRWGRGLAKSVWCNIIIPLWLWYRGENVYMVIIGNNYDKAQILLSDAQAELEANPRLIHDCGEQRSLGTWKDGDYLTKDGRFMAKALGMGQTPRGLRVGALRPNYLVCDDLEDGDTIKNPKRQDEIVKWILGGLIPTTDGPIRRYLHPNNDFAPRTIQNELQKHNPKWHVDEVKAYDKKTYKPAWASKYSDTYYQELEEDIGIIAAHSEYLNEPMIEGSVFTKDMIQWAKRPPLQHFKIIVGQWDVAYSGKNDYNAIKVWGLHNNNFWQFKAFVRQCQMKAAVEWMYDYEDTLPKDIIIHWRIESQFWNKPTQDVLEEVSRERGRWLNISIVDRSRVKKFDRLLSMHPYYQNARIYYDKAEEANNDMKMGISQLLGIEPGYKTHDDSPDADEEAVNYLSQFITFSSGSKNSGITTGGNFRKNKM